MKVVVFGGSFDGFHNGHLEIIERLSKKFDKVIVVPTNIRYYKKSEQMFSFNERYETVKAKTAQLSNVEVSNIEKEIDDKWRFVDTLNFISVQNEGSELYVAIGADSLKDFKTWKGWEEILKKSKLVVFGRPGFEDCIKSTDIKFEYEDMSNPISSTDVREHIREAIDNMDFDDMLDDITWAKDFVKEETKAS